MNLPAEVGRFVEQLRDTLPDAIVKYDRPADQRHGEWWLDISCDDFRASLSWKTGLGFGVYTDEALFGGRPDEIYRQPELAARRVGLLCEQWQAGKSIAPLSLGEVRRLSGTPQTALASALNRNQPAISRMETREDVKLSSIASYVEAMGGRLEMRVHFKDWDAIIALPKDADG